MMMWLMQNAGSLAVGLVVAGVVAAVVWKLRRDRRRGGGCCGDCGKCGGCSVK